ncbi:hypothetical protein K2173_011333 [Erythroxylum novogranatense]|uniref:Uncharacterized protein n=1 Tax=Erythroxylum novogranatense TaxID=1862640 RepID=A0AAV8S9S1_9ROSI|nr:hypothetical protein K2173_011333 [Erythroxylum novogranatense]
MVSLQLQYSCLSSLPENRSTISTLFRFKTCPFKVSFSVNSSNGESSQPSSQNLPETTAEADSRPVDHVRLAFEKAKEYKKKVETGKSLKLGENPVAESGVSISENNGSSKEVPASVKAAMEKASEYKKNKGGDDGGGVQSATGSEVNAGNMGSLGLGSVDKGAGKNRKLSISSIDFVGLDFADKKEGRGLPAGLVPITDPFPEGDMPEVEIIVGDTSKFDDTKTSNAKPGQEDNPDLYKPKVTSWGVFPRPGNISKTFGGGKTIRPGDVLETAEERADKDKRTRELIAAYKKKMGLTIDPKLKYECEKILKDGDSLMDSGKLNEALVYYEKVMEKLIFQSELHGLAALQWSICQDSLRRTDEARTMYEKLQSHPNPKVSKKASQLMFSFQAMEMMNMSGSNFSPESTGYQNYFEAFVEDKMKYAGGQAPNPVEDDLMSQVIPYITFLVFPIFIVLIIAVQGKNLS